MLRRPLIPRSVGQMCSRALTLRGAVHGKYLEGVDKTAVIIQCFYTVSQFNRWSGPAVVRQVIFVEGHLIGALLLWGILSCSRAHQSTSVSLLVTSIYLRLVFLFYDEGFTFLQGYWRWLLCYGDLKFFYSERVSCLVRSPRPEPENSKKN